MGIPAPRGRAVFRQQWQEGVEGEKQEQAVQCRACGALLLILPGPLAYLMAWKVLVVLDFYIRKDDSPEPPFL